MPSFSYGFPARTAIDLLRVRQLFSVPERVVDSNFLRREIAERMHERLGLVKIAPQRLLDAGCGDGADLLPLRARYPAAQVIGLDAAAALLAAARQKHLAALSFPNRFRAKWLSRVMRASPLHANLLCGDFAQLPIRTQAVDLVWSNLALHWHAQPENVLAEWRRVLRVDGLLMFSCFGPDTFTQLRTAFAAIDPTPQVLPFIDMHDFGDMLVQAGFAAPVMDMEMITVTYACVDKLLADVRAWGGNPLSTRRRGLLSRNSWRQVSLALEALRQPDGGIPLTFEVIYGHAFCPPARMTAQGEAIIRLDLHKK